MHRNTTLTIISNRYTKFNHKYQAIVAKFGGMSLVFCLLLLSGCSTLNTTQQDGPPSHYVDVSKIPNAVPKYEPKSRYGNPSSYVVHDKRYYVLNSAKGYNKRGIASWYGRKFQGKRTSSGTPYNMLAMTAANRTLPLPTFVRVTNLENGRQIIVKVNDRGPFAPNRIIDLSYAAARKLGFAEKGTAMVQVTAIDTTTPNAKSNPFIYAETSKHPRLYLQVGAFSDYSNATRLKTRIAQVTSRHIRINKNFYHGRAIYQVQVGPLIGVGESDRLQKRLMDDGFGHAITVIS